MVRFRRVRRHRAVDARLSDDLNSEFVDRRRWINCRLSGANWVTVAVSNGRLPQLSVVSRAVRGAVRHCHAVIRGVFVRHAVPPRAWLRTLPASGSAVGALAIVQIVVVAPPDMIRVGDEGQEPVARVVVVRQDETAVNHEVSKSLVETLRFWLPENA